MKFTMNVGEENIIDKQNGKIMGLQIGEER